MDRVSLRSARANATIFRAPALVAPSGTLKLAIDKAVDIRSSNLDFFDFLRILALLVKI